MENITIGQVAVVVTFLVGLFSGIGYLLTKIKELIAKSLEDQLEAIDSKINVLGDQIAAVDMNATKNFLVARLTEIEHGHELDEIEAERFFEQYEHYHKIGGNSYISQKVDKLKAAGKL